MHLNSKMGMKVLLYVAFSALCYYHQALKIATDRYKVNENTERMQKQKAMILSFHPCITADHQVILGSRELGPEDLSLISRARAIILPQSCKEDLYRACKNSSAVLFPDYDARFAYPGKVGQSLLFAKQGLPQPETITWRSVEKFQAACRRSYPHKLPFLIKENTTHEAEGIYSIENAHSLEMAVDCLYKNSGMESPAFISQELIPAGGNVLRVVILETNLISYWKRPRESGQIITNVGKGSMIDKKWRMDLQEKGKAQVRRLSTVTGVNLAAVDLIFPLKNPDPQPLFLEINYYFGRRGLGNSFNYYSLLFEALKDWLGKKGFDPDTVGLI